MSTVTSKSAWSIKIAEFFDGLEVHRLFNEKNSKIFDKISTRNKTFFEGEMKLEEGVEGGKG